MLIKIVSKTLYLKESYTELEQKKETYMNYTQKSSVQ